MDATLAGAIVSSLSAVLALAGVIYTQRTARQSKREDTALGAWEELLTPIKAELSECRAELRRHRIWRQQAVLLIRRLLATHPNPPEVPAFFEIEEE